MQNKELKAKIVQKVCEQAGVEPELVNHLLELESKHSDLLAWGSRPNLRRDISALMDEELSKRRTVAE
tara:strand:+ start:5629 stop:5832 length:204 start_codon:yes stop_codon:yes gene_type:complete